MTTLLTILMQVEAGASPDIVAKLIEHGPVVTVLIWVIIYFKGKEKEHKADIEKKDAKIEELNIEIRESGKESISVVKDINVTLEKLIEKL